MKVVSHKKTLQRPGKSPDSLKHLTYKTNHDTVQIIRSNQPNNDDYNRHTLKILQNVGYKIQTTEQNIVLQTEQHAFTKA